MTEFTPSLEFRQNAVTKEWVIFSTERARRPEDFIHAEAGWTHQRPERRDGCPFCPGNEKDTPDESVRLTDEHGAWQVRSFPNRFAALRPGPRPVPRGDLFHHRMPAAGTHEVVAESPRHNATLGRMTRHEVERVLEVWRQRHRDLRAQPETDHITCFKNHGPTAGTSLEHPHSQIVALPVAPWQVRHRMQEAMRHYDDFAECSICRMLSVERSDGERMVASCGPFHAFVPFAAFSPYSVWIVGENHHTCLSQLTDDQLPDLARLLRDVTARYYEMLHDPAYNLVVRVASRDYLATSFSHSYLALVPRLGKVAGFELGTGMFINASLPESDAAALRKVELPW